MKDIFGENTYGQLGTGNKTNSNVPQKILAIPPVISVDCGYGHVAIITNNSDFWSCGYNCYGQLCIGNRSNQLTFQKTSFSNISNIALGAFYSFFQNYNGKIFSCGYNDYGELGLGHFRSP